MSELKSLATIIEFSNRTLRGFSFVYKFQVLNPDKSWDYFDAWRGITKTVAMESLVFGEKADSFKIACDNLLIALQIEADQTDNPTKELQHQEKIKNLINQLQTATSSYHDVTASISLSYTPPFDEYEAHWYCCIMVGSRWSSRSIVEKSGQSLHQVCSELLVEFQTIQ